MSRPPAWVPPWAVAALSLPIAIAAADERSAGATGEAVMSDAVRGGVVGVSWREPLGERLAVDGRLGVALATRDGATAATLTNPQVALRWASAPSTILTLALTVPAASRDGDSGAVASAMAAAHRIDPAPWLARTTTVEAALERSWRRPLGSLRLRGAAAWLARTDADDLPLVRLDADGAAALTDRIELTAAFHTTSYLLVEPRTDAFVHTLALGARYRDRRLTVEAAVVAPVDAAERAIDTIGATAAVTWTWPTP